MAEMTRIVSANIIPRFNSPTWMYSLPALFPQLQIVDKAYKQFERVMNSLITERGEEIQKARTEMGGDAVDSIKDVFGRLVDARSSDGKLSLSDEEIIANCFIFIFAGHETTAGTLSGTIAFLGLYPEIQERVYNTIKEVLGDRPPTLEDFDALEDVLACFYETLRVITPAYVSFREAKSDCVVSLPRTDNPSVVQDIPLKKGTMVILDWVGLSYNPQVFPDPEKYDPWRWTRSKKSERAATAGVTKATQADEVSATSGMSSFDGFPYFSFGPRTCLGHKFAKVEAVCFLTLLLRDWRVEVKLEPGQTKEAWREKWLDPTFGITMKLGKNIPVKLVRRA